MFVAHTFYAVLMDIGPLGGRELDWSASADLDPRQPGTVVSVVSGGHVQEWRSFGAAEPFGAPLAPQSVIYVASIAKQFTAASVGLLALDGALGLEDDIRRHIRELPSYPSPVRVGHLLAHTMQLGHKSWLPVRPGNQAGQAPAQEPASCRRGRRGPRG